MLSHKIFEESSLKVKQNIILTQESDNKGLCTVNANVNWHIISRG